MATAMKRAPAKCRDCNGTGKMEVREMDFFTGATKSVTVIPCIRCDGGRRKKPRVFLEDRVRWCEGNCRYENGEPADVEFYDDGEDRECPTHHYRCKMCGGVVQIG